MCTCNSVCILFGLVLYKTSLTGFAVYFSLGFVLYKTSLTGYAVSDLTSVSEGNGAKASGKSVPHLPSK